LPGANDRILLENAVAITATAHLDGDKINLQVTITNDLTGHHVPTGSPLRQMILLVHARNTTGDELPLVDGPTLPEWCGVGDPLQGYYAGQPGVAYAKVLEEVWTGISPSGAYWNPTKVLSDNRLAAMESDASNYTFELPSPDDAQITIRLLFRRAYISLAEQKGWETKDILMENLTLIIKTRTH